jgi:RLL motif-containing protein 1
MFTFCFGPFIIKVTMSALVVASAPGPAEAAAAASAAAGLSSVAHVRGVARALGYPSWEVLDFRGGRPSREARRFVAFLEHRKIRRLKVGQAREKICDVDTIPASEWLAAFEAYVAAVGCPAFDGGDSADREVHDSLSAETGAAAAAAGREAHVSLSAETAAAAAAAGRRRRRQLHWLAGHALALEFEDQVASGTLAKKEAAALHQEQQRRRRQASGPSGAAAAAAAATTGDAGAEEFDQQLRELVKVTGVGDASSPDLLSDHQSRLRVLHAVERVVSQRCGGAGQNKRRMKTKKDDGGAELLQSLNAGLETGRPAVDKAVLVARMLHVGRLRILQNRINQVLEVGQDFVANPKTDSSLGHVGR